jgi:tripartite-type tricarboxylate transporter receptor subunit TctC
VAFQSFRVRALASLLCATTFAAAPGVANAWGDKPLRMIVPAPAGGTMDVVARILSDELSHEIGQPVIVENKPGAGGVVAVQTMRSAAPDGNTVMVTASNLLTETPIVIKVNFDPIKDIRPLAVVARTGLVLVGWPGVPAKDMKSLVTYVKANPGTVSFASYSTGTVSHFAGMMLNRKAGLDMQHVPFPGSPPALAQVMGGQIPIMFDGIPTSKPLLASGKLRAYGVTSKSRSSFLPDVPTLAELGYPELAFDNWVGVVVSASVPEDISEKIRAATVRATATAKVKERLTAQGFEPGGDATQAQMARMVKDDYERNATIVKDFGIKFD